MNKSQWDDSRRVAADAMGVAFNDKLQLFVKAGQEMFTKSNGDAPGSLEFSYPGIEFDAMCASWLCSASEDRVIEAQIDGLQARKDANAWYKEFLAGDYVKIQEAYNLWLAVLWSVIEEAPVINEAQDVEEGVGGDSLGEPYTSQLASNT